ncbi:MAG: fibronectin type III domain-containing protein [Kiritimatiellae bacterium]|nr:fibronectin type III domain-containing protein [Kiritimatiellia bacterium]
MQTRYAMRVTAAFVLCRMASSALAGWVALPQQRGHYDTLYDNVEWGIDLAQPDDGNLDHVNPHVTWIPIGGVTRDTPGCNVSTTFKNHQKDWDFLVDWRDNVWKNKGYTAQTPLWDKVNALVLAVRALQSSQTTEHPVEVITKGSWCVGKASLMVALASTMGLEARKLGWHNHTICEVKVNGKWRYVDNIGSGAHLCKLSFLEWKENPYNCTCPDCSDRLRRDYSDPSLNTPDFKYWADLSSWAYNIDAGRYWHFGGAQLRLAPDNAHGFYPSLERIPTVLSASRQSLCVLPSSATYGSSIKVSQTNGVRRSFYIETLPSTNALNSYIWVATNKTSNFPANGGDWYINVNGDKRDLRELDLKYSSYYGRWQFKVPCASLRANSLNRLELLNGKAGNEYLYVRTSVDLNAIPPTPFFEPETNQVAPAAPTDVAATAVSSSEIRVSWTDNSDNEESFKLRRGTDGQIFGHAAILPADTTAYADSGLAPGTTYYYTVKAEHGTLGDSAYSVVAAATTPLSGLPAVHNRGLEAAFPPIGTQRIGNCGVWASTYYSGTYIIAHLEGWNAKSGGDAYRCSVPWTYNLLSGGAGSTGHADRFDRYDLHIKHGLATLAEFPTGTPNTYTSWCTDPRVWRAAISRRALAQKEIEGLWTPAGLAELKRHLYDPRFGLTLQAESPTTGNWQWTTIKDDPATTADDALVGETACYVVRDLTDSGHTMAVVGWNDNIWVDVNGNDHVDPGEKGVLQIADSHGLGKWYETDGFIWLAYDALWPASAVANGPGGANRVPAFNEGKSWCIEHRTEPYRPRLLAEFTLQSAARGDIRLTFHRVAPGAAPPFADPKASWQGLIFSKPLDGKADRHGFDGNTYSSSDDAPEGTFVFDLTDIAPSGDPAATPWRYVMEVRDIVAGKSVIVKSFKVLDPNHNDVTAVARDTPLSVDNASNWLWADYPATPAPSPAEFAAYNDCAWSRGQPAANLTTYTAWPSNGCTTAGCLVDYATGAALPACLSVASDGHWSTGHLAQGADAAGGDAAAAFGGRLSAVGNMAYGTITLEFSELDPGMRYAVTLFGNRGEPAYTDRTSVFTIAGATAFRNASSAGAVMETGTLPDDTVTIVTGHNTREGRVARFAEIDPGADGRFTVRIGGTHGYLNALLIQGANAQSAEPKIESGAVWTYRKGTAEAAPGWQSVRFNDAGWSEGAAPFGYGDGPYGTTLADMHDSYTCVFLRRTFTVESPARISALHLWTLYDDGFIAWLNGAEIARVNMPGEPGTLVPCHSLASSAIGPTEWTADLVGAALPELHAGDNVLAVQVFNRSLDSSDLTFDAQLSIVNSQLSIQEDADQDRMPDAWEDDKLSGLSDPADKTGSADPDGDGLSNLEEFIAGTDPVQKGSWFGVDVALETGRPVVSFPTVAASGAGYDGYTRHYALESRPVLRTLWEPVPGYADILGLGQTVACTNTAADDAVCYRGRVWLTNE